MVSPSHPTLLLGSGNIGSTDTSTFHTAETVKNLLLEAAEHGINRIDTAGRYPSDNIGASERLLGEAGAASRGFLIDTKIMFEGTDPSGTLSREAIRKSVTVSLRKLRTDKIHILYNHIGDPTTPLEEQVKAMDEQYRNGSCEEVRTNISSRFVIVFATRLKLVQLGVCNLSPDVLSNWLKICDEKGYTKPTVYQGAYNFIRRDAETSLFPILRSHGLNFVAFWPLGGGFLTGNLTKGKIQGTRAGGTGAIANAFRTVNDTPEGHAVMRGLQEALEPHGINSIEAVLRWLSYHSQLGPADGIILGASKTGQLSSNIGAIKKGPLPEHVVVAIENVWASLNTNVPKAS